MFLRRMLCTARAEDGPLRFGGICREAKGTAFLPPFSGLQCLFLRETGRPTDGKTKGGDRMSRLIIQSEDDIEERGVTPGALCEETENGKDTEQYQYSVRFYDKPVYVLAHQTYGTGKRRQKQNEEQECDPGRRYLWIRWENSSEYRPEAKYSFPFY